MHLDKMGLACYNKLYLFTQCPQYALFAGDGDRSARGPNGHAIKTTGLHGGNVGYL